MNFSKALSHFGYKLKNVWKPTGKDIEAYNTLIDFKEQQDSVNLQRNQSLAKLFVAYFIVLCRTKAYTSSRALEVIDEILDKSTFEWCKILQKEIPMLKFNSIGSHKYPLSDKDQWNITKIDERNDKIKKEFSKELMDAIVSKPKEDDIIKFVETSITRILSKYEYNNI